MEKLGNRLLLVMVLLFLVSLVSIIFLNDDLEKLGVENLVFFVCYTTGIPSIISPFVMWHERKKLNR